MNDGAIAIIDMLGVKGIWKREKPEKVIQNLIELREPLKINIDKFTEIESINGGPPPYEFYSFSDTIIVVSNSNEFHALLKLAVIIGDIFSIAIEKGMLFRGAISVGKFHCKEQIIVGPAVDDAAEWHTSSEWAGVHFTPKTSFYIDQEMKKRESELDFINSIILKHDVPLKNHGAVKCWTVAWPSIYLNYDNDGKKSNIQEFSNVIINHFSRHPIGINEISKYTNTLNYLSLFERI